MSQVGKRRKDLRKGPPGLVVHAMFCSASLQADIAEFHEKLSSCLLAAVRIPVHPKRRGFARNERSPKREGSA